MPYAIKEREGSYVVVKAEEPSGHVYGTHPTREAAAAQVRAIEASEHRQPWTHRRLW